MTRLRFAGRIAGLGSTSGTRVVVGRWEDTPYGAFADAMVETPDGHRVLLAPNREVADLLDATYFFDEVRVEPFAVTDSPRGWDVRSPSLALDLVFGRRRPVGHVLRAVPRRIAEHPAWCTVTDPGARIVMRGVRTRGSARGGRREWYGATDLHDLTGASGSFDGADLGDLAPVDPPCRYGFSSAPRRPSVTRVVSTIEV
ncbi:hypothetical protein [Nocardioides sp. LS1]|uniref:hypothetical protein n=1 Tax=Nocardioides sp. LS1 TaxID=1027620 RepID=UPI000F621620|nr:hypothetical protein [Nocardioides sp. LS1]GCD90300.1 hypothetical protein NLS1_23060 [Nocardioides sp. LS1]